MRTASELQEQHARQTDSRLRGNWGLHVAVAFFAFREFDARRRFFAVDRGAETAQVLQKKLAGGGVAAQSKMLARYVRQSIQLEIGPVIAPAPAHHNLV